MQPFTPAAGILTVALSVCGSAFVAGNRDRSSSSPLHCINFDFDLNAIRFTMLHNYCLDLARLNIRCCCASSNKIFTMKFSSFESLCSAPRRLSNIL